VIDLAPTLAFIASAMLGYKLGWNSACRMVRDRDIAKACERYQQDRK
jgi:hypothetical protein